MSAETAREAYRKQLEAARVSLGQLSRTLREMGFVKRPSISEEERKA